MIVIKNLRNRLMFKFFYWSIRVGMGLTFISSGFRKLPGLKFTTLSIENPVGAYFNTMHETGFYWNFIGYFQILTGLLVFFNRFVVLSSLLMMPVTVNIFLISLALHMKGTPIITSLMMLANIFLILWNFENYKSLFQHPKIFKQTETLNKTK